MSKKNLEDELKNTKDALQCEIEFSSMRKLEIKHLQTTLLEVTHMDVDVVLGRTNATDENKDGN